MSRAKTSKGSTGNLHVDKILEILKTKNNYSVFDKVTLILARLKDKKRIGEGIYEEATNRAVNIGLRGERK